MHRRAAAFGQHPQRARVGVSPAVVTALVVVAVQLPIGCGKSARNPASKVGSPSTMSVTSDGMASGSVSGSGGNESSGSNPSTSSSQQSATSSAIGGDAASVDGTGGTTGPGSGGATGTDGDMAGGAGQIGSSTDGTGGSVSSTSGGPLDATEYRSCLESGAVLRVWLYQRDADNDRCTLLVFEQVFNPSQPQSDCKFGLLSDGQDWCLVEASQSDELGSCERFTGLSDARFATAADGTFSISLTDQRLNANVALTFPADGDGETSASLKVSSCSTQGSCTADCQP